MKFYALAMPVVIAVYHWLLSQKVSDLVDDFRFLRAARMELIRRQQQTLAAAHAATTNPPQTVPGA